MSQNYRSPNKVNLIVQMSTYFYGIELMNVDDPDQHTKEIKVGVSSSQQGPWNEILHEVLPDTRTEPLSLLSFGTSGKSKGRFLKCQILDKYGTYAGLKHFSAYSGF